VGLKGEYTAAMLDVHKNLRVSYPYPPALGKKFNGRYGRRTAKLPTAVRVWLERMGLADQLKTDMTSKVGYQLTVRPAGVKKNLDLTSLGVGVSQVLPTIVMALLAPKDSVLIFEQPEVHLHPKVQSVLGDFFLGIIDCGKQCIVETHSEHLINRIRRRIAESSDEKIQQQLGIYFVELKNGVSQFRSVKMNEYGAIVDWPAGFFDEVEEESAILLDAAMEKWRESE
jgi:predicted ATPase